MGFKRRGLQAPLEPVLSTVARTLLQPSPVQWLHLEGIPPTKSLLVRAARTTLGLCETVRRRQKRRRIFAWKKEPQFKTEDRDIGQAVRAPVVPSRAIPLKQATAIGPQAQEFLRCKRQQTSCRDAQHGGEWLPDRGGSKIMMKKKERKIKRGGTNGSDQNTPWTETAKASQFKTQCQPHGCGCFARHRPAELVGVPIQRKESRRNMKGWMNE